MGTDFKRLIVCRPRSNNGVERINFLKEERSTWLRKRWKVILLSSLLVLIIFCFLALSKSWEKKSTANLVVYDTMEVRSADPFLGLK
jgi:hypothetical protein